MSNITIGRYDDCTIHTPDGHKPLTDQWAGWIEGETTDGTSWIIYLDGTGRPALFWPQREPSGAVTGDPIKL